MSFLNLSNNPASIAHTDCNVPQCGGKKVSSLSWSPTANILVSSNWDSTVRIWDVDEQGGQVSATPQGQVNHENSAPVLDTCFSPDGSTVFSVGADNAVRMWELDDGQTPPNGIPPRIGRHDEPIGKVGFLPYQRLVVSGGWDGKVNFWDLRSPNPAVVWDIGQRVDAMDVRDNLLVVATSDLKVHAYDAGTGETMSMHSPLRFESRCIACLPDLTGFAIGSIEGRAGIVYWSEDRNYSFKCHREGSHVYSVNDIAFNNRFGTFAMVGSDGVVNFWDKDKKQRLKEFHAIQRTIPCASFNAQGNLFAYASSYDGTMGVHFPPGNEIFIHQVGSSVGTTEGSDVGVSVGPLQGASVGNGVGLVAASCDGVSVPVVGPTVYCGISTKQSRKASRPR